MTSIDSSTPERTAQLGFAIAATLTGGEIIAVTAPLGAGKTVLAKGIASGLGITDTVTSPTYTIVSEYAARLKLIHVDLYRVESEDDYEQLAVDELLGDDTVAFIEWPERAGASLPEDVIAIDITIEAGGTRKISLPDSLARDLPAGALP